MKENAENMHKGRGDSVGRQAGIQVEFSGSIWDWDWNLALGELRLIITLSFIFSL